jgi:hypothetical protein
MAKRFPVLVDDALPQAPPVLRPGTVVPGGGGYHDIATSPAVLAAIAAIQADMTQVALSNCGDGSDGAIIFDGINAAPGCTLAGSTYTLTRTLQATTVRHDVGVTRSDDGFVPLHRGEYLWNGEIKVLPKNGGTPTAGAASWTSSARTLFPGGAGGAGKSGGAGNGTTASSVAPSLGGSGGKGGNVGANTGGNGGASTYVAAYLPATAPSALLMHTISASNGLTQLRAGAGGGGGAADATGTGGGGGSGGGQGEQVGHTLTIGATATLSCAGGNGGNAGAVGNAGGGGGGGGGHFRFCAHVLTGTVPTAAASCPGGTGGAKTGTGVAGVNGSVGTVDVILF